MLRKPPVFLFFLLCAFSFISLNLFSQVKKIGIPLVRNYHSSEIGAGAQTWMIDTSKDGLAYFANNDGVLEFDGQRWRLYPLPGGIVVRSVKATDDGRIYAGGFNQIGFFAPDERGKLNYNSLQQLVPNAHKDYGEVWKIYELPYGIVFQSYEQLMIYHDNTINIISAPGIFHFSYLVNNELYINDQEEGLYRLAHDRLIKIPGTALLRGKLIWSILPRNDNILIATADEGVYEFDGLKLKEWDNPASKIFKQSQIYCGLTIQENVYAFGTIQDGLIICDGSGNVIQHINIDKGLQNNTILSIDTDQYGNIWLGEDNGLDYVEINSPLTYFTHFNSLSAGYTAVLHKGILYLGTNRGVFYHDWEKLKSGLGNQKFEIVPGTRGQVWDLKVVDGTLFCGHNSGIFIIKGINTQKISDVQGGWTFLQPKKRNDLLICGTYTNLVKFERINGEWQEGQKIGGFNESSRFLTDAGDNKIWMTHGYLGAFRLHLDENYDSVRKVELYNSNHGLPSDKNVSVFEIFNRPVFTTESGFYKYDARTNNFIPDNELNSTFKEKIIYELQEDEEENIWYFTMDGTGVFRLQEDGSYVDVEVPFRELKGRFIKWFQFVYPLDNENVFFGIQDGFVHYTPGFPKNYKQPLNAFIRRMELLNLDSILYFGGIDSQNILPEIPFRYNQLQIEFSANDFENPNHILYSTFLEGFDDGWSAWQSRSIREFTNLRHGIHTFHVKARNIFGTESEVSTVNFEILPPWYLKWWAFLIYALAVAGFFLIVVKYIRYRIQRSKKQEEERQKQLFREREKQLETEALEAEKEIINLRNEKLKVEMMQKDKELANNTMQMIQKSNSLNAIKKELKKLSKEIDDELIQNHINLMIRKINREIDTENQWKVFEEHFESVHQEFLNRLKARYPDLTPREMKLCAYLRLNISSKEIATLMNISTRGVEISRYRLRKKLSLGREENLTEFIMTF